MPFIPGLTSRHFTAGSYHTSAKPILTKDYVADDGETFDFRWKVRGSHGETYKLWASGNILERKREVLHGARDWRGFDCYCSCPNHPKQVVATMREPDNTEYYVCKHLNVALESVIDEDASINEVEEDPFVPGLTNDHFINGGLSCHRTPTLTQCDIDYARGDFRIEWEVPARWDDVHYELWASGNICRRGKEQGSRKWWGFDCGCSCPNYWKQASETRASGERDHYVCKHLAEALSDVVEY